MLIIHNHTTLRLVWAMSSVAKSSDQINELRGALHTFAMADQVQAQGAKYLAHVFVAMP